MDLVRKTLLVHQSAEASSSSSLFSPLPSPPTSSSIFGKSSSSSSSSSDVSSFPIIAVTIIGILATGFLLVSYYIFVIKCCLNWHRIDLLRRFSFSPRQGNQSNHHHHHHPLAVVLPSTTASNNRGLDESVIRSIPILKFKKQDDQEDEVVNETGRRRRRRISVETAECAVCLNDFQDNEKLRSIPNCGHIFHIDCIDIWLQNNANCPLCRNSISSHQILMSSANQNRDYNFAGRDEDYVVIEIADHHHHHGTTTTTTTTNDQPLLGVQERLTSKKMNKYASSKGDECIDIRQKDEQFAVQPIRRSFSMDSASDRLLYLAVQEAIHQQQQSSSSEGCSSNNNNRVKRSFFSFGHGSRGARSAAVLPLHLEP